MLGHWGLSLLLFLRLWDHHIDECLRMRNKAKSSPADISTTGHVREAILDHPTPGQQKSTEPDRSTESWEITVCLCHWVVGQTVTWQKSSTLSWNFSEMGELIHWTLPIYKELVYKTLQFMRDTRWVKHVPWPQSVYNLTERIMSIPTVTMQQERSNPTPSHLQECLPVIHITFNNAFPQTRSITYSQVGPF